MNVIAIEIARAAQLFVADEVKPRKGTYFPDIANKIKERYQFVTVPNFPSKEGTKFQVGRLIRGGGQINIADLTVYTDGVVVEAPTTDDANIVLDDFLPWIFDVMDVGEIPTKWPRSHISGVVVEFEQSIEKAIDQFRHFNKLLADTFDEVYKFEPRMATERLAFGSDMPMPKVVIGRDFTIDRRVETTHEANRFYSASPFPTQTHINLLRQFETLLG